MVLLNQPDKVRHQEIRRRREYYVSRWGGGDTTHAMAVYIDGKMDGKLPRPAGLSLYLAPRAFTEIRPSRAGC